MQTAQISHTKTEAIMKETQIHRKESKSKTASRILALVMAVLMVAGAATYTVIMLLSAFAG